MVTFDAGLISGLLLSSHQGRFLKVDDKSCHSQDEKLSNIHLNKDVAPISQLTSTLMAVIVHGHLMTKEHAHFMCDNLECSLLVSCAQFAINVS